eukprot:COSAG05_NODE_3465_length_2043_cov_1.729424_1_plen_640_part_00
MSNTRCGLATYKTQFCFDTVKHDVFGYIVPSWVESPVDHVPRRHQALLHRLFAGEVPTTAGGVSTTGTLLVCPIATRVKGLDLMRDLSFDGLSLAFLKNLEKISFVSSVSRGPAGVGRVVDSNSDDESSSLSSSAAGSDGTSSRSREYRVERSLVFEHGGPDQPGLGWAAMGILNNIRVVSHRLSQVTIIEWETSGGTTGATSETRRLYRLHSYVVHKYMSSAVDGTATASASSTATGRPATTTISLAFPVDEASAPLRSSDGELVFAYLPVTAAGFGFAINADFELVASRQDVSDSHSGNHVLLGRVPALFVHSVLVDPALGEDAFPTYLPDVDAVRNDRSGGGRKWLNLALALHRETGAWMMIETEDGEKVKRRHVVLRPRGLSERLVPNSLLKAISEGDLNFAHPQAVRDMALENCIDFCPASVMLDCIRVVLGLEEDGMHWNTDGEGASTSESELLRHVLEGGAAGAADARVSRKKDRKSKKKRDDAAAAVPVPSISKELLLDIWQYLSTEISARVIVGRDDGQQGEEAQRELRLIVDALIGGVASSSPAPFRIFPVRGSTTLRRHSEHGVPLSLGLSPCLAARGTSVLRLAQQVVPRVDIDRLASVKNICETLRILHIHVHLHLHGGFILGGMG